MSKNKEHYTCNRIKPSYFLRVMKVIGDKVVMIGTEHDNGYRISQKFCHIDEFTKNNLTVLDIDENVLIFKAYEDGHNNLYDLSGISVFN